MNTINAIIMFGKSDSDIAILNVTSIYLTEMHEFYWSRVILRRNEWVTIGLILRYHKTRSSLYIQIQRNRSVFLLRNYEASKRFMF